MGLGSIRGPPPPRSREGLSPSLHRRGPRHSYTNRSSFQKTASTNEWEWTYSAERFGAHGVPRGFSYKEKQELSCKCMFGGFLLSVCACGLFVNDHRISIQNLIAFLCGTLKETQHRGTLAKKNKARKKESSIKRQQETLHLKKNSLQSTAMIIQLPQQ